MLLLWEETGYRKTGVESLFLGGGGVKASFHLLLFLDLDLAPGLLGGNLCLFSTDKQGPFSTLVL